MENQQKRRVGPVTVNSATGSGVAGAVTVVAVWALAHFAGVEVPTEVASALTVLLAAAGAVIGGWSSRPDGKHEA